MRSEFEAPQPYQIRYPVTEYLLPFVSHTLVRSSAEGQYAPGLIEELPKRRVTTTGLGYAIDFPVVRLKFRKEARWGDGSPITGWDVLHTWLHVREQETSARGFSVVTKIFVSQRDPRIFELTLLPQAENMLRVLSSMHVLPRHARFGNSVHSSEGAMSGKTPKVEGLNAALYNGPYTVDMSLIHI